MDVRENSACMVFALKVDLSALEWSIFTFSVSSGFHTARNQSFTNSTSHKDIFCTPAAFYPWIRLNRISFQLQSHFLTNKQPIAGYCDSWVKRPHSFSRSQAKDTKTKVNECPFCKAGESILDKIWQISLGSGPMPWWSKSSRFHCLDS